MMNGSRRQTSDRVWVIGYVALCFLLTAVAWTAVVILAPQAEAAPTARPIATVASATATLSATPTDSPTPGPATPTPVATPTKAPFNMDIYRPDTFITQNNRHYCTAGAVQNMLNIIGPTSDLTSARQIAIATTIVSLTSHSDSLNGGFGPVGWAKTMEKLGGGKYEMVIEPTFDQAMRHAALALAETSRPVGLLTWWGAHSWVMTGFKSDADPMLFPNTFKLKGAYIVDPYYPRKSDIWGQTLAPDTFRSMADMAHNYIGWKRPEGKYPDRDGKWLLVIPVP